MRVGLPSDAPRSGIRHTHSPCSAADVQVRADDRRAARRRRGRRPRHERVREAAARRRPVALDRPATRSCARAGSGSPRRACSGRTRSPTAAPSGPTRAPARCDGPSDHTREPNGLPDGTLPSGFMRRILPLQRAAVLRVGRVAGVADARVELAVGPERDPPAVVDARLLQARQHGPHAARRAGSARSGCRRRPCSTRRPVRSRAYRGETASPSSPPSPARGHARDRHDRRGLPPPAGIRRIRPVVRSATSASPSGRNAIPHGTRQPGGDRAPRRNAWRRGRRGRRRRRRASRSASRSARRGVGRRRRSARPAAARSPHADEQQRGAARQPPERITPAAGGAPAA